MVSDNPETFADLDGHEADNGSAVNPEDLVDINNGEAASCGLNHDCPEALEYDDGPKDTSQDQQNAEARDDATVDATKQQVKVQAIVIEQASLIENGKLLDVTRSPFLSFRQRRKACHEITQKSSDIASLGAPFIAISIRELFLDRGTGVGKPLAMPSDKKERRDRGVRRAGL